MKKLLLLCFLFSTIAGAEEAAPKPKSGFDWSPLKGLAIQSRGRLKPVDTYARESVAFITGKEKWDGYDPMELIFAWLTGYEKGWEKVAMIRLDYGPIKKLAGFKDDDKYFSPAQIRGSEVLRKAAQEAAQKQNRKEKLNETETKLLQLQNQFAFVEFIARGEDMTILPNPKGLHENWFALSSLNHGEGVAYSPEKSRKIIEDFQQLAGFYTNNQPAEFNTKVVEFAKSIREDLVPAEMYPKTSDLKWELHYNQLRPFRWAWISYLLAFLLLLGFSVTSNSTFKLAGASALALGFFLHSYGFALRCLVAGRPPVTNMYESVIWVTWGCVLFSILIWASYKNHVIPTAATVFAIVGLVLADNLPSVLDPGIHPLEPVLRSNFWLTIHVLTITLGYAAFALSLCLGNVIMGYFLFATRATEKIQAYQLYMYRAVQIGVVLIAAGTILGGIWADYSWGRFWGWDPKEVWALIALLLYLAVLHGRFAGWLKGFGFAATTVVCFLGVLMAWYGVNFVLGAGLHSYGFGTGGKGYILAYIFAQLAFIGVAYAKYKRIKTSEKLDTSIFPRGNK